MRKPESIIDSENRLEEICNEYPVFVPVNVAAKYLGMDITCLRDSIDQGKCRFGIGGRNNGNGNRFAKIPTLAFYNWVTMCTDSELNAA